LSLTEKQRNVLRKLLRQLSFLEKDTAESFDRISSKLKAEEERYRKIRQLQCDATNTLNGIIPYDGKKLQKLVNELGTKQRVANRIPEKAQRGNRFQTEKV
jgi:hypothetical protein